MSRLYSIISQKFPMNYCGAFLNNDRHNPALQRWEPPVEIWMELKTVKIKRNVLLAKCTGYWDRSRSGDPGSGNNDNMDGR